MSLENDVNVTGFGAAESTAPPGGGRVWHYVLDDEAFGPTTGEDLGAMARRGLIDHTSLVWREGWDGWRTVSRVGELHRFVPVPAVADGAGTGERAGGAGRGPALNAQGDARSTVRLFLLRVAAAVIDQFILLVPTVCVLLPVMFVLFARGMTPDRMLLLSPADAEYWLLFLSVWLTHWVYAGITESSALMGTIGKRACGLRVTDLDGRRLSFARASARYWGKVASTPLFVGYMVAVLTGGRRALHDLIAGTTVQEKR